MEKRLPIDLERLAENVERAMNEERERFAALPKRFKPEEGEYVAELDPAKRDLGAS